MATREVLIPLKKHLVKFCHVDLDKIYAKFEEHDEFDSILSREFNRENMVISNFEIFLPDLLKEHFRLSNYYGILKDTELSIKPSRKKKNLDNAIQSFLLKGYKLTQVKINSPVFRAFTMKEKWDCESNPSINPSGIYRMLNIFLETSFKRYVMNFIEGETPKKKLNLIYGILGLDENDIKSSAILRFYHRNKNNQQKGFRPFGLNQFDREVDDKDIYEIAKLNYEMGESYSQIAKKYQLSKSKIARICTNIKVKQYYKKVNRFHSSWIDYQLSPLRKKPQ